MTGIKITSDGIETELPDTTMATLQDAVGGYIRFINIGNGKHMIVNKEGLRMKLPKNEKTTSIAMASTGSPGAVIVGDVVVCDEEDIE